MAKIFRPSNREASILSKIESTKEHNRRRAIGRLRDIKEPLSNAVAMKLVETGLVETTNKNVLEEQILFCFDTLCYADDFDVDFLIAPIRNLVPQPNIISLYTTAFVIEKLIDHKVIVDIFGSDQDIYICIHEQVAKHLN